MLPIKPGTYTLYSPPEIQSMGQGWNYTTDETATAFEILSGFFAAFGYTEMGVMVELVNNLGYRFNKKSRARLEKRGFKLREPRAKRTEGF